MLKKKVGIFIFIFTAVTGITFIINYFSSSKGSAESESLYEKLANKEDISYLIIGDSIGRGSGVSHKSKTWFSQMENALSENFKVKTKRHLLVQSGATAFEGLYKLQNGKPDDYIDLIFIVFGENDRKYMNVSQFAQTYEALIRKAKQNYPDSEIITFTESSLTEDQFATSIKDISDHYNAKNIDMRLAFSTSGLSVNKLTTDLVHPNDRGYELYSAAVLEKLQQLTLKQENIAYLADPLHPYAEISLKEIQDVQTAAGFTKEKDFWISESKGDILEYSFTGSMLGIRAMRSELGGKADVYLDGKWLTEISTWWPFERERYLYIASGLENTQHTVTFVSKGEKSLNNTSSHHTVAISSIITDK
ncbi:SGNH/GDSL hydrolase family protein [Cytobacillus gottheilii]|uniref:SGNH/GDSL hydrolase family protein n=1 Tax=Cytobacillus gottheilii TaxID=859144 RepID=UPI0009BAB40B|nr:SGNH/GDSL hydrolase family protein [Cytobacillus gottheilii]